LAPTRLAPILSLAAAVSLGGCSGALSTLEPAGRSAEEIAFLWWLMLAGGAGIFLLVMVLLALAFRRRRRQEQQSERLWIMGGGLVFTSAVLMLLLGYGIVLGERLIANDEPGLVTAEAEARQWQWTFRTPGADGATIERVGVLDIPAGVPVDLRITSADVIHSFWAPRLAGKLDAIPGKVNVLRIQPAQPGIYQGVCAEYCGVGHARMPFLVVVHDGAAWAAIQGGSAR